MSFTRGRLRRKTARSRYASRQYFSYCVFRSPFRSLFTVHFNSRPSSAEGFGRVPNIVLTPSALWLQYASGLCFLDVKELEFLVCNERLLAFVLVLAYSLQMRKELRPVHPGFQVFDSSKDIPYVWNYDPVTSKTVMYVGCLFRRLESYGCRASVCVVLFASATRA